MLVRLVLLALLVAASGSSLASPGVAAAQRSTIPPLVISNVGDCDNAGVRNVLREDVYTPEIVGGWQIVVPLRGEPNPDRTAQTLPPAADEDFVLDVFAMGNVAEVPGDLDPFSDFAIAAPDGVVWYARSSGYFWLLPSTTARECFRRVTGGQSIVG
jgi:hypothetical protein